MSILSTTLGQMAVLFLLISLGFLLGKLKLLPADTGGRGKKGTEISFKTFFQSDAHLYDHRYGDRHHRTETPPFVTNVIDIAGSCMSPVAMLLTGITVSAMPLKKVLSQKSLYAVSLIRLILFPLFTIGAFYFIPADPALVICTVCSVAMPLGLNTIVIPAAFGKDTSVAAGMAIVSHLISCITIPLIFALMMKLL
jgi:predicted permease